MKSYGRKQESKGRMKGRREGWKEGKLNEVGERNRMRMIMIVEQQIMENNRTVSEGKRY